MKLVPTLLQLHIYLGLLCIPLFLVFGLSSLHFNHQFLGTQPLAHVVIQELTLPPQQWPTEDLRPYGESLRDSLGLFGWYIPWASHGDRRQVTIQIEGPMKEYVIQTNAQGTTTLTEKTKDFAHLLKIMHFLGEDVPNAPWWLAGWKYYQRISVYAMLCWVASGIYLWWRKRSRSRLESRLLWTGLAITSLFILTIWLVK
jgi:hypothetical protein